MLSSGHTLYIYPTRRSNRHQASQERLCCTIVKTENFYKGLISPVIFVKEVRSAINLRFPAPVSPWCYTNAMITLCLVDISFTNTRLTKPAIDFGGRRHITTSQLGARIVMPANDGKHGIADPSYPQVTSLLIAYFNVFQWIWSNTKRNQYPQQD